MKYISYRHKKEQLNYKRENIPEKEHGFDFPYGKKDNEHLESSRKTRMLKKFMWP